MRPPRATGSQPRCRRPEVVVRDNEPAPDVALPPTGLVVMV